MEDWHLLLGEIPLTLLNKFQVAFERILENQFFDPYQGGCP